MGLTRIVPGLALLILGLPCVAQKPDTRPEFEVATIHPVKLESRTFPPTAFRRDPVRIAYNYVSLAGLVAKAYDLPNYRIEWPERLLDTSRALYSIAATFPQGTTDVELQGMLQRLLEDRLALRTHWVNKTLQACELRIAPGGARLRRSTFDPDAPNPADPSDRSQRQANRYSVFQGLGGQWRATGVISLAQLTSMLGAELGKPLIDKTGMDGYYDIDLSWSRPTSGPPALPGQAGSTGEASIPEGSKTAALFPALEKQLGLRAGPTKLVVDVLTIDSVEQMPGDE